MAERPDWDKEAPGKPIPPGEAALKIIRDMSDEQFRAFVEKLFQRKRT